MNKEAVRQMLPEEPSKELVEWARDNCENELGNEFCIFYSERLSVAPTLVEIMEYNTLDSRRKEWGAVCSCTACGEEFITQKEPGENAIRLVQGEDGWNYTIDVGEVVDPYMGIEVHREDDLLCCPLCGSEVRLIHARKIRGGRKKQIMVIQVENVGGYTALIYWMCYRIIEEYGVSEYGAVPVDAFVLTETGAIVRYTHQKKSGGWGVSAVQATGWRMPSNNNDTIDSAYYDWGSINNKKVGALIYESYPDLEGTTGEKTALVEYLKAGGYRPVAYLKWWRKQRNIENLCRQGQGKLVAYIVSSSYRYSYDINREAEKYLDLTKRKPHEMMGMTKAEFRWLRQSGTELTIDGIDQWRRYREAAGTLPLAEFTRYCEEFGQSALNAALQIMRTYGDADIDKIHRYMSKNGLHPRETGILLERRNCMRKLYNRPLTSEELWPKRLHETHDRVHQMWADEVNRKRKEELLHGFQRVIDRYGCLEWTDGELSVILPTSAADLVREGKVLRHCVGGYGNSHVSGASTIFFIRRYRRPERPYYTLAIDMTGKPKESQLHGYGNERHGDKKQYTHTIPKKVRAFCDRWENEILLPWYAEQQKNKEAKTA
jgi:hypothetical protein